MFGLSPEIRGALTPANEAAMQDVKDAQADNGIPIDNALQLAVGMDRLARTLRQEPETFYSEEFDASNPTLTGRGQSFKLPADLDIIGITIDNQSTTSMLIYQGSSPGGRIIMFVAGLSMKTFNAPNGTKSINIVPNASPAVAGTVRVGICNKILDPNLSPSVDTLSPATLATVPTNTAAIAAAAATADIKASPGKLFTVTVTTSGANADSFTDGPGGIVLLTIPAGAVAGSTYPVNMPAFITIRHVGGVGTPALTVSYA